MRTKKGFFEKVLGFFGNPRNNTIDDSVGHGGFYVDFEGCSGFVYGGPYAEYTHDQVNVAGVNMTAEIPRFSVVRCPIKDFSVPTVAEFKLALLEAMLTLRSTGVLYVGCAGGTGRTGLFLAGILKLVSPHVLTPDTCIQMVRKLYKSHAVETREQENFLREVCLWDIEKLLANLN